MMLENYIKTQKLILPLIFLISLFLIITMFYFIILNWEIECNNPNKLIIIPKGAHAGLVTDLLVKELCLQNEILFKIALTITMNNKKIRSGRYNFKGITKIGQLINVLTSQSSDRVRVTLVEGWSMEKYADELYNKLKIDKEKFINLCKNSSYTNSLGIDASTLEGFLFPDTYIFLKTYAEEDIINVLVNQFKYNYNKIDNISNVNMSMLEIVSLASIIQGEAIYSDEMPIISSVYHNRLKKNMLLQADPTIQYILPEEPRRLYNKDLKIDNPYNTYKYKGLPPGPINNPGLSALIASINPHETEYLYFVSNLEGRHTFTLNSRDHNKAKQAMKKKRRLRRYETK